MENYYGILIMTTNRDHDIDKAFDSRIDIRLRYDNLEKEGRAKVWKESLSRYGNDKIDVDAVASWPLNNSEISRIVKLANITAGEASAVTTDTLLEFINLRKNFKYSKGEEKIEV
jgi:SpoVK/Ycf46/Vps4 family AAA+-type ATPase